jgi:hypothetical protein
MAKVFLTNASNDLYLNSAGHLAITNKNREVAAQLAKNFLWTFKGEIFTDQERGTDYFGIILNEFTSLQDKLDEITRRLLMVPFVESIESMGYSFDRETGVMTINPTLNTTEGPVTLQTIGVQ